jgi:hypothetical protein
VSDDDDDDLVWRLRRNSRCRCASWRAYRQCCWEKDERYYLRERQRTEPYRLIAQAAKKLGVELDDIVGNQKAYAKFAAKVGVELPDDDDDELVDDCATYEDDVDVRLKDASPFTRERARDNSLSWHLNGLETDDLLQAVRDAGVPFDPEAFRAASRRTTSAWALGVEWRTDLERAGVELRGLGMRPLFVEFVSCVLWERLVPERMSQEQVDDLFELGNIAARFHHEEADALAFWRRAWLQVEGWLHPEVSTIDTARLAFTGAREVLQKYVDTLGEVLFRLARSEGDPDPQRLPDGIDLLERFVRRFSGEPGGLLGELEADIGEVLFRSGARHRAEVVMARLQQTRPAEAVGYVRHAVLLTQFPENGQAPSPLERAGALTLLQTARDRARNAREWNLDARITAARLGRGYAPPRDLGPP